jgi:flagellar FliL protein
MAEEKTEEAAAPAPEPAPSGGGGGGKLMLILIIVNTLITAGMVGVLFISFKKDSSHAKVEDIVADDHGGGHGEKKEGGGHGEKKEGEHGGAADHGGGSSQFGKMVTLEQFTINLSTVGTVNPKFARVNISIEVPNADTETELTQKMPQVRNTIIDLFNSKRPADLATSEGRNYLKDEIKNALNSFLVTGKVKGVFFTNFAIAG